MIRNKKLLNEKEGTKWEFIVTIKSVGGYILPFMVGCHLNLCDMVVGCV